MCERRKGKVSISKEHRERERDVGLKGVLERSTVMKRRPRNDQNLPFLPFLLFYFFIFFFLMKYEEEKK
jgi:hypothetical protein